MAPPHRAGGGIRAPPPPSRYSNNATVHSSYPSPGVEGGSGSSSPSAKRPAASSSSAAVVVLAFAAFVAAALLAARGALPSGGDAGRILFLALLGVSGAALADGSAVRFILGGEAAGSWLSSSSAAAAEGTSGQRSSFSPSFSPLAPRSLGAMLLGLLAAAAAPSSFRFGGKEGKQTWAIAARVVGASPAVARAVALAAAPWRRERRRRQKGNGDAAAVGVGGGGGAPPSSSSITSSSSSSSLSYSLRAVALASWLVPGIVEIAVGSLALGIALRRAEAAKLSGLAEEIVESITWPAAVSAATALAAPARGSGGDLAAGRGPLLGLAVASICGALSSPPPVKGNDNNGTGGGGSNSIGNRYRRTPPSPAVSFTGSIASAALLVPLAAAVAGGVIGILAAWVWSPKASFPEGEEEEERNAAASSAAAAAPRSPPSSSPSGQQQRLQRPTPSFFLAAAVAAVSLLSVAAGEPEAGLLAALVAGGCSAELWCRAADADGDAAAFLSAPSADGGLREEDGGSGNIESVIVDDKGEVSALASSGDGGVNSSASAAAPSPVLPAPLEASKCGLDVAWTTLFAPLLYAAVGAAAALTHARAFSTAASRGIAGDDGPFPPTRTPVAAVWPPAAAAVAAVVAARVAMSLGTSMLFSSSSSSSPQTPPPASPLSAAARAVGQALRANHRGEISAALPPAPFAGLPPGSSPAAAAGSLAAFLAITVGQACEFVGRKLVERADAADGVVGVPNGNGSGSNNSNGDNPASSWSSPVPERMPSRLGYTSYGEATTANARTPPLPLSSMFFKKTSASGPGNVELRGGPSSSSSSAVAAAPSAPLQVLSPRGGGEPSPRIGVASAPPQMQQQQHPVSYYYGNGGNDYNGGGVGQQGQQNQQQQQLYRGGNNNNNNQGSGCFADINLQ